MGVWYKFNGAKEVNRDVLKIFWYGMRVVSAELRTFATELSSLKAEMNNPLRIYT